MMVTTIALILVAVLLLAGLAVGNIMELIRLRRLRDRIETQTPIVVRILPYMSRSVRTRR